VLLDEFVATVTRAKEEQERQEAIELDKRKIKGCLDQVRRHIHIYIYRDIYMSPCGAYLGDIYTYTYTRFLPLLLLRARSRAASIRRCVIIYIYIR